MRQWPERKRSKARIEIIPMIDVMMFLLVFFVLISINVLPALALHVALPVSAQAEKEVVPRKVTISIAPDGGLALEAKPISLPDLTARLTALHKESPDLDVIIAGDKAALLQNLIGVLDALKAAGIGQADIITKPA